MPNNVDNRIVTVSVKIYGRLLACCPADFRREYGPAMRQLFRDQCRDAWGEGRGWSLMLLWLRVLPDLAKTSLMEHLATLNQKESTFMKIIRAFRSDPKLRATFLRVFALVIVCVLGWSAFMAYWSPRIYSSTARIEAQKSMAKVNFAGIGQTNRSWDPYFLTTQFRIITSFDFLSTVVTNLNLTHVLAVQAGEPDWSLDKTVLELKKRLRVASTRGTDSLEISFDNATPEVADGILKTIVGNYLKAVKKAGPNLLIQDHFTGWLIKGTLLAILATVLSAWLAFVIPRSNYQQSASP